MSIASTTCKIAAALLGAVVIPSSIARPATTADSSQLSRYQILLNKEPKLCAALRNFYNRHLGSGENFEIGYVEDQFERELYGSDIELVFPRHNWHPVSYAGDHWLEVLGQLDIYGEGKLRTVLVLDEGINVKFVTFHTVLAILKPEARVRDIPEILDPPYIHQDPRVEQWIDFGNRDAQRLVRYQGHIYGVARQRVRTQPFNGANIHAYSVAASGVFSDVCYLEVRPV